MNVPFSPLRTGYQRWCAHMDSIGGYLPVASTDKQRQAARDRFASMTSGEVEQDIRARMAVIRKDRRENRRVTEGAEQAMRKMLTEELGLLRVRYSTVVTLHRVLSRLEDSPNAPISQYDDTLGDEKTIRGLQHVLADAGYLTQAPLFYGNGKATLQAFRGTGKPRHHVRLIPSENYWDGEDEFNSYSQPSGLSSGSTDAYPSINEADVPY